MSFRFKPEDFQNQISDYPTKTYRSASHTEAADIANQLLDAHIATLPEVKGWNQDDDLNTVIWFPKKNADYQSTHRARLWGLEEIKQKKCEHPMMNVFLDPQSRLHREAKCMDCGKRLVAKWEEADV